MRDEYARYLLSLHSRNAPIYAVVDGASYDNLPEILWRGDFKSKSLYLDRGDNDPEQIVTAPHLVVLDEMPFEAGRRSSTETLAALFDALGSTSGVVFWHGLKSAEHLFKHLRGLNVIHIPIDALATDDQAHIAETSVPVLFRHADANALAQVITSVNVDEASRLMGPASTLVCQPDAHWCKGLPFLHMSRDKDWPTPAPGMLSLSEGTMTRMEQRREDGLKAWALDDFSGDSETPMTQETILDAFARARVYRLEEKDDIWEFIELEKTFGPSFEERPGWEAVANALKSSTKTAKQRIFYAALACDELSGRQ